MKKIFLLLAILMGIVGVLDTKAQSRIICILMRKGVMNLLII